MSKVRWLPGALADLVRLVDFLRSKNEDAAHRALRAIQAASSSLADAPYKGSPLTDGSGRRKLIVPFGKFGYVIYYSLDNRTVFIVGVYHGRENHPH
jgi:plasmid stabilization system protein ParE